MATYKKLTINVSEDVHAELSCLARSMGGITITDLIKRSVALHKFIWENRDADLLLKRGDDIRQIVPL